MTLEKLIRILISLRKAEVGIKPRGCHLYAEGDELKLDLNTINFDVHQMLERAGFVEDSNGTYIYRPKRRGPHRADHHPNVVYLRPDKR